MADPDPVEAGLEKTRLELEALADRLSPPETATEAPTNPLDSDDAKEAGLVFAEMIGASLRSLLFDRPEKPRPQRRPWRFTSPVQAVVAAPPLRPVATAPPAALATGSQLEPPKTSGTPNSQMSFVGFLDDRPRAAGSSRFPPTEPFAAHERRLDIDDRTPLPRSKELKGPIVGGIIPPE